MNEETKKKLIRTAFENLKYSYAPYSKFNVAAALLGKDGNIYAGVNVENSCYPAGICAERNAVFSAVAKGCREFEAIAICGGEGGNVDKYCFPCGICRQVISEFVKPDEFKVICAVSEDDYAEKTLGELLPDSFAGDMLKNNDDI
ncbi:MAG: cytidine deaminase [Firmicutes bacterium]|nr:cytidine deaminase [Bacillota bacterium]